MARSIYRFAGLALLLFAAGCSQSVDNDPNAIVNPADVYFFHASPATGAINLKIDNRSVADNQAFGDVRSNYVAIEAGTHSGEMVSTGSTGTVVSRPLTFARGARYSLFAFTNASGSLDLLSFHDDLAEPPINKAKIRIANLITDAPQVRLAFPGSGIGPIVDSVGFADVSEGFELVDAQAVTLRFVDTKLAGGGGNGGGGQAKHSIVADVQLDLQNRGIYTIALVGHLADSTARAVVIKHPSMPTIDPR